MQGGISFYFSYIPRAESFVWGNVSSGGLCVPHACLFLLIVGAGALLLAGVSAANVLDRHFIFVKLVQIAGISK